MAKKKAQAKKADERVSILLLKGSPDYRDWISALAEHARLSRIDIIDHALIDYAKKMGFATPPPRR